MLYYYPVPDMQSRKYIASMLVLCLCLVTLWVHRGHNHSILQCRQTSADQDSPLHFVPVEHARHHGEEGAELIAMPGAGKLCSSCLLLMKCSGAHLLIICYSCSDPAPVSDDVTRALIVPDNYHAEAVLRRGPPFSLS